MMNFLQIKNNQIVDSAGRPVFLKGIALGGWLMMEGYMLGGRNIPEHQFKEKIRAVLGNSALKEFIWRFRENFFTEKDILKIKALGANCVRLPFNYRLLEKKPHIFDENGFAFLKKVVGWFKKAGIYVILDLHAGPGGQNPDWHSDSAGCAEFWEKRDFRARAVALWAEISRRFCDEPVIAGYDILNEPVTDNWPLLNEFNFQVTRTIRQYDQKHIIFYEGNHYARDFSQFKKPQAENLALSIHFYDPHHFVFRWVPGSRYPGQIKGDYWNRKKLEKNLAEYKKLSEKLKMPVYLGEFGVASRCPECGAEYRWVSDVLEICQRFNFHWTYWTYKSVAGAFFPDGIYQYFDWNDIFQIHRIISGVEKFPRLLKENKERLYQALKTENFTLNEKLAGILKKSLLKRQHISAV